jgi:hypothetical protein
MTRVLVLVSSIQVESCIDYDGDSASVRDSCSIAAGVFDDGAACPSDVRLGGCRGTSSDLEETWWFYEGAERDTEIEIREFCTIIGYEYVAG